MLVVATVCTVYTYTVLDRSYDCTIVLYDMFGLCVNAKSKSSICSGFYVECAGFLYWLGNCERKRREGGGDNLTGLERLVQSSVQVTGDIIYL